MPENDKPAESGTSAETTQPEGSAQPTEGTHTDALESAPFVDDIIIWDNGLDAPRKLTRKDLIGLPKIPSSLMPPINSLIQQGVTIAAIPTTSGIGAACYLVNLATLKKPDSE